MERRQGARQKRRVTCEIEFEASRGRGIVLDVSPRGLFIQTDASPAPGTQVRLSLRGSDGEAVVLDAEVARKRLVPRQLASVATGGIGLRIAHAPEAYYRLLAGEGLSAPRAPGPPPRERASRPEPEPDDVFRVRAQQQQGPRSRSLLVAAGSEEEARARVLEDLGSGWQILAVEPA